MFGAGNEIRTRDPNLGKVVLYQLSYSRLLNVSANLREVLKNPRTPWKYFQKKAVL